LSAEPVKVSKAVSTAESAFLEKAITVCKAEETSRDEISGDVWVAFNSSTFLEIKAIREEGETESAGSSVQEPP